MRIGLFGGSFDPPHAGHLMASTVALQRLRLDRVWWLVSPHNPLKPNAPAHDFGDRVDRARRLARDPRIVVTGIEAAVGSRFTLDVLEWLARRLPGTRLVWLMGADNLATFHRWHGWRNIAALMPIAVVDRPGSTFRATASPAARTLAAFRLPERSAAGLADRTPPAWTLIHGPRLAISSTALRG